MDRSFADQYVAFARDNADVFISINHEVNGFTAADVIISEMPDVFCMRYPHPMRAGYGRGSRVLCGAHQRLSEVGAVRSWRPLGRLGKIYAEPFSESVADHRARCAAGHIGVDQTPTRLSCVACPGRCVLDHRLVRFSATLVRHCRRRNLGKMSPKPVGPQRDAWSSPASECAMFATWSQERARLRQSYDGSGGEARPHRRLCQSISLEI